MKNILDRCHCGSKLLPQKPLPRYQVPMEMSNRRIGGDSLWKRRPESTETLLSHLACEACGLIYKAEQEGMLWEELRKAAYPNAQLAPPNTNTCVNCFAEKAITHEYANGPYGVLPERVELPEYHDPREHMVGVYCTTCNSVMGVLPPDPEKVKAFDEHIAAVADRLAAERKTTSELLAAAEKDRERFGSDDDDSFPH